MSLIGAALLALLAQSDGGSSAPMERTLLAREYDRQIHAVLDLLVSNAGIGPYGEVFLQFPMGDQRFLQPNSGFYWQISGAGQEDLASRSLWGRKLRISGRNASTDPISYDSNQFPDEPLKVIERTARLPGSDVEWHFIVARPLKEVPRPAGRP